MTNQYDDAEPEEDEPEDELPDVNAEEEEPEEPEAAAGAEAPVAAQDFDAAGLKRRNELLEQQLIQTRQAQQQQAANAVQQWLAAQPPEKQVEYRRQIEDAMREAEDKRRVMWTIAQQNQLRGQHLQDFYAEAQAIATPEAMQLAGSRYKRLMELETGGGAKVAVKEKPAMARTRPDGGAPQGNRPAGKRMSQDKIVAQYMPGGPKQGDVLGLERELAAHGYYD